MDKPGYKQYWTCVLMNTLLCFIASATAYADTSTTQAPNPEYELRAAVVIGILRFATQYDHDGTEYPLCLIGAPPSSNKVIEGAGLNISKNRKLTVQAITPDAPTASCAAIVMGPDLTVDQQALIAKQAQQNSSILICDDCRDDEFAHVSLRRKDERIVFAVDIALAQQSKVAFSSKLLSLAIETRR